MIKTFLEAGQIVGTHGVRGEMRVNPWCDSPDFLKGFKTLYFDDSGERAVTVISCRTHGNIVLLKIEDIDTVEEAAALRGKMLFMRRSDARLPKGSYFVAELFECKVVDADDPNIVYGTLADVSQTGANDVWHIKGVNNKEYLIPAIPLVVIDTDVEECTIKIRPLEGIFDDED